ncbi:hypothetical protein HII13_002681 [Brettanomyces bruxellensis]|nr:hypothetical protein HII13_002681 [Brettanomyces bruxellensis]
MVASVVPQKRKTAEIEDSDDMPAKNMKLNPLEELKSKLSYSKWMKSIRTTLKTKDRDAIVTKFEEYLTIFKNDGKVWAQYIKYEMEHPPEGQEIDKQKIEKMFAQTLTKVCDLDLWKMYLKYEEQDLARSVVLKAFQFAAENVGIDYLRSSELWTEYIKYLNGWKPTNANEAATKTELTRQVMVRMISVPSLQLEENWKMYIRFENAVDQAKARKNIDDHSPDFMKLRPLSQELYSITNLLKENNERRHSRKQLARFALWIKWERANKLSLTDDAVEKRVNYVYRLSTQMARYQPEVWYNYASYLLLKKKEDEALDIIRDGLLINPQSAIGPQGYTESLDCPNRLSKKEYEYLKSDPQKNKELDEHVKTICSCYIMLMKQTKRMATIKEVRRAFALARKFEKVSWQVYVSYALIEYQCNEVKVAVRSFELAMRHFGKIYDFVSAYLDFLIGIKDMTNCKKVIEISLDTLKEDPEATTKLFRRYMKIELSFGDTNSIRSLENRFIARFPDTTPFELSVMNFESDYEKYNACLTTDKYISNKIGARKITGEKPASIVENNSIPITDNEVVSGLSVGPEITNTSDANASTQGIQNVTSGDNMQQMVPPRKPFVVRDEVYNLLRVLPKADYYSNQPKIFDVKKTVKFLRGLNI